MQATPRVFATLDLGAATTAAALIGRIERRWRLLGALSGPALTPPASLLELLAGRIEAADPALADAVGLVPGATGDLPTLVARSTPPAMLAVLAASERALGGLATELACSGWRWVGMSVDQHDVGVLTAMLLNPAVSAVLVAAGAPPGGDERAAVAPLGALAAAAAARRPDLAIALAGSLAGARSRFPSTARVVVVPAAPPGSPPWAGLSGLLAGLRSDDADSRVAMTRSLTGLAGALDRRLELLEIGFDGGVRATATPEAEAGAGTAAAVTSADAALVPPEVDDARLDRILDWSTLALDRHRLRDRLLELRAMPWAGVAGDGARLRLAAARAALERLLELSPGLEHGLPPDLIVVAGGVFVPVPGSATLLCVADVVRRSGAYQVALDHARLLGPLGTIEDPAERDRVLSDLAGDLLVPLGAVVMPGDLREARRPGTLVVAGPRDRTELPLIPGSLERVPLPAGQRASVLVESLEPVRLGGLGRRLAVDVAGGIGGLLIDLRDVPLRMPDRREARRELLLRWQESVWPESAA